MDSLEQKLFDIKRKKILIKQNKINQIPYKYIENSDWLMRVTDNIFFNKKDNTFIVDQARDEKTFLSYKEANFDYSILPNSKSELNLNKGTLKVNFIGEVEGDLEVFLQIDEYTKNEHYRTHFIKLNENNEINLDSKIYNIRLAISIKGAGKFKINEASIDGSNFWIDSSMNIKENYSYIPEYNWYYSNNDKIVYDKVISGFFISSVDQTESLIYGGPSFKTELDHEHKNVENHYVEFYGKKDKDVKVELLILYTINSTTKKVSISLNESRTIEVPKNANSYKIYLEVQGKGFFKIEDIIISGFNYWPSKSEDIEEDLISIENPNNIINLNQQNIKNWNQHGLKLSYNKWNQQFKVNLKGKQFLSLSINEYEKFIPAKGKIYEILPKGKVSEKVKLSLGIIAKLPDNNKKVYQIPFNFIKFIQFPETILDIDFYLKVEGNGYFSGLTVEIKENPEEVTSEVILSLEKEDWFTNLNQVTLRNTEDSLVIQSKLDSGVNKYISYRESNNTFNIPPTLSILNINPNSSYEFNIRVTKDDTVQLIPMIVGYSEDEKIEVQQIKVNAKTIIKPHPGITSIRIALRLGGKGECIINSFTIKEKPIITSKAIPSYANKLEVEKTQIVEPKPISEIRMAVIFDEFTESCFKHECKVIKFSPDNWMEVLTREQPDLLMVESAWKGNDGTWERRVGSYGEENNRPLFELIDWCNENGIPTVFWNKEDPIHFERFINIAKLFDYVFTTDENTVPKYIERLGHTRVGAMPFAAQPKIHNPIKFVDEREEKACFAGSYYSHHKERSIDMEALLDAASEFGLDIFDRNYEKTSKGLMPNHTFPDRFKPFIKGSLRYYEIDKAYKGYKVTMNVNTVKLSDTMFSRRVYESLACGTPVVSNYSKGIVNMFNGIVFSSDKYEELKTYFRDLLKNEEIYKRISHLGIREVLNKHTYKLRLFNIVSKLGISVNASLPEVTVIGIADNSDDLEYLIEQFNRQSYKNKKLFILVDTFTNYDKYYKLYNNDQIQLYIKDYVIDKYPNIVEWVDTEFISFFSKDDFYGKNYLHDLVNATNYTNADFIGKKSYCENLEGKIVVNQEESEYEFVTELEPANCIVRTTVFSKESFRQLYSKLLKNELFTGYYKQGRQLLSVDNFNYIKNGRNYTGDTNELEI